MALQGFFPSTLWCRVSEIWCDISLSWFEPTSVELHQTGTFEGRSTNWATAPLGLKFYHRSRNRTHFCSKDQSKRENFLRLKTKKAMTVDVDSTKKNRNQTCQTGFNTSWEADYGSSTVVKRVQYASQWHEFKCDRPIEPGVGATTFPTLTQA